MGNIKWKWKITNDTISLLSIGLVKYETEQRKILSWIVGLHATYDKSLTLPIFHCTRTATSATTI